MKLADVALWHISDLAPRPPYCRYGGHSGLAQATASAGCPLNWRDRRDLPKGARIAARGHSPETGDRRQLYGRRKVEDVLLTWPWALPVLQDDFAIPAASFG